MHQLVCLKQLALSIVGDGRGLPGALARPWQAARARAVPLLDGSHHQPFLAPVELERLTQLELQWHEGVVSTA